jgi:hypothetical protein
MFAEMRRGSPIGNPVGSSGEDQNWYAIVKLDAISVSNLRYPQRNAQRRRKTGTYNRESNSRHFFILLVEEKNAKYKHLLSAAIFSHIVVLRECLNFNLILMKFSLRVCVS